MSELADLLDARSSGALLRWASPLPTVEFAAVARASGWAPFSLGPEVAGRTSFLEQVGAVFGFPETYGRNFDALADLLREVVAAPDERGTVLLWDGWATWASHDRATFEVALDVLAERAEESTASPFLVLLAGTGPSDVVDLIVDVFGVL